MAFCGLCKQTKDPKYNWFIQEMGADAQMAKFKVCDECASLLLKGMTKKIMGIRDEQPAPDTITLNKTGIIDEITLSGSTLDITIAMDIGKARRWVEKESSQ